MQAPLQARNAADVARTDTARTVAQKRALADDRPQAVAQRKLAEMMNNSPRVLQQRALSKVIHNSAPMVAQRKEKTNHTGLPDQLKSGIEALSGMSMDHVKVHYNSPRPAQLQAHAYAQGSEIHLGAGQERHLPHEAWHVVQQAQGRVQPTLQMKAGAVNDDPSLETEADTMGERAVQFKADHVLRKLVAKESATGEASMRSPDLANDAVLQAKWVHLNQQGTAKINLAATSTANIYVNTATQIQYTVIGFATDGAPIVAQSGTAALGTPAGLFQAGTMHFTMPQGGVFSAQSAQTATRPYANTMATLTGHPSSYGVKVGDVGSYKAIQHLEKTGDQLTGDHQPSGAAIKEAIRQALHGAMTTMLTRSEANHAYQKAITIVMTDAWHKAQSRTYGGRNSKAQIGQDAADLMTAAMEDWKQTVPELEKTLTQQQIQAIWANLEKTRKAFYGTGDPQVALL